MTTLTRITILSFLAGLYVGCSPVKFGLDDSQCKDSGCVVENGKFKFNYSVTAAYGKVDILIVNDNSASMSFEQARLAPRFKTFIEDLDRKNIDYRIGMTTTDVTNSPRAQGGKLIPFGSYSYLTPKIANRQALFNSTIQRPETLACESFIANWIYSRGGNPNSINNAEYRRAYDANCPSGDERGVYSANLLLQSNPSSFIRPDAHLAVIFLSDEDERSGDYLTNPTLFGLEHLDQPATLTDLVKSKYGNDKYHSLSVHAIAVGDDACLDKQNNQILANYPPTKGLVQGSIGYVYLSFVNSKWGKFADICSEDYPSQLGQIQSKITDKIKDILLNCSQPSDLVVTVSGTPVSYHMEGKKLVFSSVLNPGSHVNLSYTCSSLN